MDDILARSACFQVTGFPDVDEAWLEEKARAIGEDLMVRFGGKLEWGQVVTLPTGNGIGIVLLLAPGCEQTPELARSLVEIICQQTGVELPKSKRGKAKRKGGMPQFGLGPRFPAEFYESHGRIGGVSPAIHSGHGTSKRSGTQKSGRQGA
jgi:hypothetical protein